ncbi:MAG: tRNA pseudouridine(55) synthase TruB [Firmicutes bacterium]|nr:tRNA pseudouridine(55) synthase TruB [Bacillota bacterium]
MKDGIIILNKPQEWTSSDCVAICRRNLKCRGIKKVGHGGTLDPMATGVLPIFIGQATRIMEYMELDYKAYRCTARLGLTTDTLDVWGQVIEEVPASELICEGNITEEMIRDALAGFVGHIEQIPPKYSAVRVNGRRLYDYMYKGEEIDFEIKPRPVHIKSMDVLSVDLDKAEVTFDVTCSKGTYIRTICSDLGEKLGCGCAMTKLERRASGIISLDKAGAPGTPGAIVSAEQVKTMTAEELEAIMIPADYPLVSLGSVEISEERAVYFSRGNSIWWTQVKETMKPDYDALRETGKSGEDGDIPVNHRGRRYDLIYKVYQEGTGQFLGTGYLDKDENRLKADKVFISQR